MKKQNEAFNRPAPPKKIATKPGKVEIRKLPTGVRGLDEIMGGGVPEFSFNVIAGTPGCGKTTLASQIIFANATPNKPGLYFTVLGEPALKMLRHQQQFSFFDEAMIGRAVRFINLGEVLQKGGVGAVFEEIVKQVTAADPSVVVVDSFRTIEHKTIGGEVDVELQSFLQRLAQFLTSWQATTFLVGEYVQEEIRENPLFTVADGLIWLWQVTERNSVVRKLQVMKLRGQASVPGLHTIRIGGDGLQAFSRTLGLTGQLAADASASYLSGLLIGHEVRAAMPAGANVTLIGSTALCALYTSAIAALGGTATIGPADAAAQGLAVIGELAEWI